VPVRIPSVSVPSLSSNEDRGSAEHVPSQDLTSVSTDLALNCTTCLANFECKEVKRGHMRAEWQSVFLSHPLSPCNANSVYNLKRRIASLPPNSLDIFETQVRSDSESKSEKWKAPKAQNQVLVSEELESQAPEEFAALSPLSDNEDGFEAATCLFRSTGSSEMQDNLTHMAQAYSFTIPFADRLINTESFLHYLHTLVSVFFINASSVTRKEARNRECRIICEGKGIASLILRMRRVNFGNFMTLT